jgi:phosphoribosylanthranilate isomerase
MVEIKICGMRREEDIAAANALLPDYIGFVFAQSRRQVSPRQAQNIVSNLDSRVCAVGVFVGAPLQEVAATAALCNLCAVQLHGGEGADYIKELRPLLPKGCEIWSAARVKSAVDIEAATKVGADRLLLDAFSETGAGGTGKSFDWSLLNSKAITCPFFVAGGLTVGNVLKAIDAAKMVGKPFGIDVSGGVETDGYKDFDKMAEIIRLVRNLS